MNKKESLEINFYPYVRGWAGGESLYSLFSITEGDRYRYSIDGIFNSAKMQVATKFLVDGKRCKLSDTRNFQFKADEKDVEFFKVAKILPARKWKKWHHALGIFKSKRDKNKVLEYLQTEAVAEKLSQ